MWGPVTGDYIAPDPEARGEGTAATRKCLAAANAARVYHDLYETATEAFISDGTDVAVYEAVLGGIIAVLGPWAGFTMASGIGLAIALFFAFYELLETITSDVWTSDFDETFVCLLLDNATDTAGVVTFDWVTIRETITENLLNAAGQLDTDTALLWAQLAFIMDMVGAPGLDLAGTTTAVTSYDCTTICAPVWCYSFDFTDGGAHGWTFVNNSAGNPFGSAAVSGLMYADLRDPATTGSGFRRIVTNLNFPAVPTSLTQIEVTYDYLFGGDGVGSTVFIKTLVSGVVRQQFTRQNIIDGIFNGGSNVGYQNWSGSVASPTSVRLDWSARIDQTSPFTYSGNVRIKTVTLRGTGTNPWGADNCE